MDDTWTITVDRERCMGSGICLVYAAGTFDHDEDAKAVVTDSAADPINAIRVAAEACPTSAIQLALNDGV
ncbi:MULTISPECIES: ferredoxin [Pseudofrankia]|uniref:ferredoxin n=1 Tax=Pseudofrankia TaxID=2994363 RepID=UPI000234B768|nr:MULTISPECIES: ferredoxin [Pseudofrankia]OHV30447.1 ferredoxin [Pseudofrankia sp. EUN1h]